LNKSLFFVLIVFLVSVGFSAEQDSQFLLPDLFVTAKDERGLDSSAKIDLNLRTGLRIQDNIVDGSLQKDMVYVEKLKLNDNLNNAMYNDVSVFLGMPSLYGINFNHGYVISNIPYFLRFNRYDNLSLYGVANGGGSFFVALKPDKENGISFISKQKRMDGSQLDVLGIGYKRLVDNPISYSGVMLNANSYAGNAGLTMTEHNLDINLGKVSLLNKEMDSAVSLMYLGSKVNSLFFVDLGLNNAINTSKDSLDLGLQLWSNAGIQKFNILVDYKNSFMYESLAFMTRTQLVHDPVNVNKLFATDFIEMDDAVIKCDERFSFSVSVNGILKDQKETFFMDMNFYNYKNVLDDIEPLVDKYYSYTGISDLIIANTGVLFPEVKVASETVSVKVQLPIVSKKVPNLFSKLIEVTYAKEIFEGNLSIVSSYCLREFGRTTGDDYKNALLDVDASYEKAISNDWSYGLYMENLFSAGSHYLPDRNFRDTVLYGKLKVIF